MNMTRRLTVLLAAAALTVSVPAFAQAANTDPGHPAPAHPAPHGDRHQMRGQDIQLDWSAFPADIQAMKTELDGLRTQQRAVFERMKAQRDRIRAAHRAMSEKDRRSIESKAKAHIGKLRASRDSIRKLRAQKHEAWGQFRQHTSAKQWDAAKADLRRIIDNKKRIMAEQSKIVSVQEDIAKLLQPSSAKKE